MAANEEGEAKAYVNFAVTAVAVAVAVGVGAAMTDAPPEVACAGCDCDCDCCSLPPMTAEGKDGTRPSLSTPLILPLALPPSDTALLVFLFLSWLLLSPAELPSIEREPALP